MWCKRMFSMNSSITVAVAVADAADGDKGCVPPVCDRIRFFNCSVSFLSHPHQRKLLFQQLPQLIHKLPTHLLQQQQRHCQLHHHHLNTNNKSLSLKVFSFQHRIEPHTHALPPFTTAVLRSFVHSLIHTNTLIHSFTSKSFQVNIHRLNHSFTCLHIFLPLAHSLSYRLIRF